MDTGALADELRQLILTDLVPLDDDELTNRTPLVDTVLDSLGIAELAVFIEEKIGRTLRAEEETRATFANIDSIIDFIAAND